MRHWLYQGHVEPVLPTPRVGQTIPWLPVLPDLPVRRASLTTAVLLAASVLVPVVATAEVVTADKWHPQVSIPTKTAARVIEHRTGAECPLGVPATTAATRLDWAVPLSVPVLPPARVTDGRTGAEAPLAAIATPPTIHLDWSAPLSVPTRALGRAVVGTGADVPLSVPAAMLPTFDWWTPITQPRQAIAPRRLPITIEEPVRPWQPPPAVAQWYPDLPALVWSRPATAHQLPMSVLVGVITVVEVAIARQAVDAVATGAVSVDAVAPGAQAIDAVSLG